MRKLESIDSKIQSIVSDGFSASDVSYFLSLIEEKLRILRGHTPGFLSFDEYIKDLDIGRHNQEKLIMLRNTITKGKDPGYATMENVQWLRENIVPSVLRLKKKDYIHQAKSFERKVYSELSDGLKRNYPRFHVERQFKSDKVKFDFAIAYPRLKREIVIEVESYRMGPIAIGAERVRVLSQLRLMLVRSGNTHGVLVTRRRELHYLKDTSVRPSLHLLVVGVELSNWVNEIIDWGSSRKHPKSVKLEKATKFWEEELGEK